jgi:glycosidase
MLALLSPAGAQSLEPLYPEAAADALTALARPPVRHPFQDEVLYFILPDRFGNGSSANDCGAHAGECAAGAGRREVLSHGFLPGNRGYYHGGDLAGVSARLDYLTGLGVTALWLAPVFTNKPVQPDSSNLHGHSSAYHGYWVTDFLSVDPHFGTNDDFRRLVDAAHERGIKVFMDIITNHTADVIRYEEGRYAYRSKAQAPYVDAAGKAFDDAEFQYHGQADYEFPEMDLAGFPYTPTTGADERGIKNPPWLNDPLNYHNRGNTTFTGEDSVYGDFFGLDDLFTERREVVEGMIDIYRSWIEGFGVDGFRIDTTKHVRLPFWQAFGPAIVEAAAGAGTGHFFAFGEVYAGDPAFLALFSTEGRLQATLDFPFQQAAREFASAGGDARELRALFEADDYYTDADSNAYAMPVFVGNHDMGRIGYFIDRRDQPGADDDERLRRSLLAHALMFFARGQPVIYYGDEQGFTGDGGDKLARQDMFESRVAEYNDDDLIGTDATTAADNFDPTHPLYRALAGYARLYREHPALRRVAQIHRFADEGPGVYAFSRVDRDERVEYVVALNNGTAPATARVPTYYGEGVAFERLTGEDRVTVETGPGGGLALTVPALGFDVYRAARPLPAGDAAPGIAFVTPAADAEVELPAISKDGHHFTTPLEIGVALSQPALAEVTFAARVGDGPWRIIGTDDNPPYRVFYRVAETPTDAELTFAAVADDLAGHRSVATLEGIRIARTEPAAMRAVMTEATFRYVPPAGREVASVSLRGTMNGWGETPMVRSGDGSWTATVSLPAGTHQYKFFIDGAWPQDMATGREGAPVDPQAEGYHDDGFGGRNAVRTFPP